MNSKFVLLLLISNLARAQNVNEWVHQKATQKKYLEQQISALQVSLEFAKQGVEIVGKGLATIDTIKKSDFNLHFYFFDSLQRINPKIKNAIGLAEIIALPLQIATQVHQTIAEIRKQNHITPEELNYCVTIFDNVFAEALHDTEELLKVVTDGNLVLTDDERIRRIESIFKDMQQQAVFARLFCKQLNILSAQSLSEGIDLTTSKRIHGFNNK
jgi:hypothetical protein